MITDDCLGRIMPRLSARKRAEYLPALQAAMQEYEIDAPLREAAFLAQIAHESGELRYMEEIWGPTAAQKRYEPPGSLATKLGNTETGDGRRFKGRGPIQITGRANYQKYGDALDLGLVADPELAARPEAGFRVAGLFWNRNGLNELADLEEFKSITRRINGGLNGLEDRLKYYARAKEVLGIRALRVPTEQDLEESLPPPMEFTRGREAIEAEVTTDEKRLPTPRGTERKPQTRKVARATSRSVPAHRRDASLNRSSGRNRGSNKSTKGHHRP